VKLFGGLLALMLAVGAVSFWAWRASPAVDPCQDVEVSQSRSPDGRVSADVYEKRCGESVTTHVGLRRSDRPLPARGDIFIAAGRVPAQVRWDSDREAVVESPATRVLVQESSWKNVGVRVRLVR